MSGRVLMETNLGGVLPPPHRGKVRDTYDLDDGRLLVVTTDRISAFDVIMGTGIAGKGQCLNQMSAFWLAWLEQNSHIKTHFVTADWWRIAAMYPALVLSDKQLADRSMVVKKLEIMPVEAVIRGYLVGSGWKEYQATGKVCGIQLPTGLRFGEKLGLPIFTPATKAQSGHDENISFNQAVDLIGEHEAVIIRCASQEIYQRASAYAATRGVLILDTKFEWGKDEKGNIILADEVLTPDSSRFELAEDWAPGKPLVSLDKQVLRDWLEGLVAAGQWNKQPPGPELPSEIVKLTAERYRLAFQRLVVQ